jgi:8-oxo-dGTP diphosphatase
MSKLDMTTMVMVRDRAANRAVVIDRIKSWTGLSFPGGHLEDGESLTACAEREVHEETGLVVRDLKPCGVIHWMQLATLDRYIAFLFRTDVFIGDIRTGTDEGRVFWMDIEELKARPSTNGFDQYLPLFLGDEFRELYIPWDDDNPWGNL